MGYKENRGTVLSTHSGTSEIRSISHGYYDDYLGMQI